MSVRINTCLDCPLRKNNIHKYCTKICFIFSQKKNHFLQTPRFGHTHTQKHTRRFPFQVRRLEMRVQPIGLHIETALVSEVWSGLGDLFVGFVKLSFVRFVGGMVV